MPSWTFLPVFLSLFTLSLLFLVLVFSRYDFHRDEANYHYDVYVDDLD